MFSGRKSQAKLQFNAIASVFVIAFAFLLLFPGICSSDRQNMNAFASGINLLYDCINRDYYCKINNVKKSVAFVELKLMVNRNIIEPVGKGKATFYVLSGRLPDDYRTMKRERL